MDDRQILKLFFVRAEGAIEALAEKFGNTLERIAMNILENREDAQESTNDTYLALWNAIPPQEPEPLAPYVYRTGRNVALKHLAYANAQKRCSRYDVSLEELSGCLPGEDLEQKVDARAVGQAMDAFLQTQSRENRYIFLRRYWYGDSVRDIAGALKMQENAVSVRLNRLRGKLKDYLIKEGFYYES